MEQKIYTKSEIVRKGVFMIVLSVICTTCVTASNVWGIISPELIANNGWTNLQASLPATLCSIMNGISGIVAGAASDSKSPGRWAAVGGMIIGAGLVILGFSYSNWWLVMLSAGLLLGSGTAFSTVGLPAAAMKWMPPDAQAKVVGICTAGLGLSSLILPFIYTFCNETFGFSKGLIIMGIVFAVICVLSASLFRAAPQSVIDQNRRDAEALSAARAKGDKSVKKGRVFITPYLDLDFKQGLRTKQFRLIFICHTLTMAAACAMASQSVAIVQSYATMSMPPWMFVALGSVGGICGRVFGGAVGDRLGLFKAWSIIAAIYGISYIIFPFIKNPVLLFIIYFVSQFTMNCCSSYDSASNGVLFNKSCSGRIMGIGCAAIMPGALIGPTVASLFADYAGTYTPAFMIFGLAQFIVVFIQIGNERWAVNSAKERGLKY